MLGFIFLGVSITYGLSPHNRLSILALAMVAFSLAAHYLSHWKQSMQINEYVSVKYSNILRGVAMLVVTFALGWWLWVVSGQPTHLH